MNRRDALKAISALIGSAVVPSAQARLFADNKNIATKHEVLSNHQALLVEQMAALVLALDEQQQPTFNLVAFVDLMLANTVPLAQRKTCLQGADSILRSAEQAATMRTRLMSLFDVDEGQLAQILAEQELSVDEIEPAAQERYKTYQFIFTVREFLLLGYFTAQNVQHNAR